MTPNIRDLLSRMESISPSTQFQKTMTPDLLQYMAEYTADVVLNARDDHTADLIIGAFFFAKRSCEFTKVSRITKTIMIRLGGIRFYTYDRVLILYSVLKIKRIETRKRQGHKRGWEILNYVQ